MLLYYYSTVQPKCLQLHSHKLDANANDKQFTEHSAMCVHGRYLGNADLRNQCVLGLSGMVRNLPDYVMPRGCRWHIYRRADTDWHGMYSAILR